MSSDSLRKNDAGPTVRHRRTAAEAEAGGLVEAVYKQMAREFAIVPPLTIYSVVPEILAGVWCVAREAFVVGAEGRARREAVAAAVSLTNSCTYCVDVHTSMLHAKAEHDLATGLLTETGAANAARADPLIAWALATGTAGAAVLDHPPFSIAETPRIFGTAAIFHFVNRMVNIFLDASPMPVRFHSTTIRSAIGRLLGATLGKRLVFVEAEPGLSLNLLADRELPEEFRWATPDAAVAGALARMSHAIETHGEAVLPLSVRTAVRTYIAGWNGGDPGMSRKWLDDATTSLPGEAERVAAQLALLAALASYRVDDGLIDRFRTHYPDRRHLIAVTAWGSFEAVRRLSTWLAGSAGSRFSGSEENDATEEMPPQTR